MLQSQCWSLTEAAAVEEFDFWVLVDVGCFVTNRKVYERRRIAVMAFTGRDKMLKFGKIAKIVPQLERSIQFGP